jgi:hypothetical protein
VTLREGLARPPRFEEPWQPIGRVVKICRAGTLDRELAGNAIVVGKHSRQAGHRRCAPAHLVARLSTHWSRPS